MSEYNITINWIRHGESCANLGQQIHKDVLGKQGSDTIVNRLDDEQKDAEYDMLDEKQEKASDNDEFTMIDSIPPPAKNSGFWTSIVNNVSSLMPTAIKDTTAKIASAFLYEPNLSFIGMNHAINLGTNYFVYNNNEHNIYISSPLTRTITTALLSLRFVENAVIYVVPYINEKNNPSNIVGMDYQNTAVDSVLLKKKILFVKEWLEHFWIIKFDDIEIRKFLINIYEVTSDDNLKRVDY